MIFQPVGLTLVDARPPPARPAKSTLRTEMVFGRRPTRVSRRAIAAAHLESRARKYNYYSQPNRCYNLFHIGHRRQWLY